MHGTHQDQDQDQDQHAHTLLQIVTKTTLRVKNVPCFRQTTMKQRVHASREFTETCLLESGARWLCRLAAEVCQGAE